MILCQKGWEKTNCKYKCTSGQQKGREPGLHTHGNARGWLGHAISSLGKNDVEVWGKGAVVMEQTQKGLPAHVPGLERENVEGIM